MRASDDSPIVFSSCAAKALEEWRVCLRDLRRMSNHTLTVYFRNVEDYIACLSGLAQRPATIGDILAANVTDGRAWLSSLQKRGVSGRSANVGLSAVRNFYRFLQKQGYGENEAMFALRFARKEKLLPKPAAHADVVAILRQWTDIFPNDPPAIIARDIALFVLLYGTGMRISEALSLRCGDIGGDSQSVIIRGKGNKERLAPITSFVGIHIAAYKQYRAAGPEAPLFVGAQGKSLHPDLARRRLRTARRALGLGEHISPHSLRHGFATELLEKGGDLRVIQELLGHANVSTTEIYAKLSDTRMADDYLKNHPRA